MIAWLTSINLLAIGTFVKELLVTIAALGALVATFKGLSAWKRQHVSRLGAQRARRVNFRLISTLFIKRLRTHRAAGPMRSPWV